MKTTGGKEPAYQLSRQLCDEPLTTVRVAQLTKAVRRFAGSMYPERDHWLPSGMCCQDIRVFCPKCYTYFFLAEIPRTCSCGKKLRFACPWVGCKYHLFLDVDEEIGSIRYNYPGLEPDELERSCVIQMVLEEGTHTCRGVGRLFDISHERVRQTTEEALERAKALGNLRILEDFR